MQFEGLGAHGTKAAQPTRRRMDTFSSARPRNVGICQNRALANYENFATCALTCSCQRFVHWTLVDALGGRLSVCLRDEPHARHIGVQFLGTRLGEDEV